MAIQTYQGKTKVSYRVYWRNPITKKQEYEHFDDENDAIAYNAQVKKRLKKDPFSFSPPVEGKQLTFEELAEVYLAKHRLAESNFQSNYLTLKNDILPDIGDVLAEEVSKTDLSKLVDKWTKRGNKSTSIKRKLTYVKAILSWGVENGYIEKKPDFKYRHKEIQTDSSVNAPTPAEIKAIYSHASKHVKRAILLGINTGARPGESELLSIKWTDIYWEERKIRITSAKKGGPKTRYVYINDTLYEYLLKWWKEDKGKSINYIVHAGNKKIERIRKSWNTAKKKAGITTDYPPYSLRHYFATQALSNGVDVKTVASILGNTPAVVLSNYAHAIDQNLQKAMSAIPSFDDEILNTNLNNTA